MANSPDPADFFRTMLGQWEKMTNSFGGEALKSEEFARGMNTASTASMAMQQAFAQSMEKSLAAANLPSRTDIEDLARRIAGIESTLARIEAALGPVPKPDKPRPTRGRKPPKS